jgi:hypothetical protein
MLSPAQGQQCDSRLMHRVPLIDCAVALSAVQGRANDVTISEDPRQPQKRPHAWRSVQVQRLGHINQDKYLHTTEDQIMDTMNELEAALDRLDAQREVLTQSLNEITNDIGMALRDAGLDLPIFIAVRQEGEGMATIATPADPSDDDWQRASTIACQIISEKIGCGKLRRRELACAMARGSIAADDLTAG